MKLFYHYHISKTGGTFVRGIFYLIKEELNKIKPGSAKLINVVDSRHNVKRRCVNFDKLYEYSKKYEYVFLSHHNGYKSLYQCKEDFEKFKKKMKRNEHGVHVITSIREPVKLINSMINYNMKKGFGKPRETIYDKNNINYQLKYIFYNHVITTPENRHVTKEHVKKVGVIFDKIFSTVNMKGLIMFVLEEIGIKELFLKKDIFLGAKKINTTNKKRFDIMNKHKWYVDKFDLDQMMYDMYVTNVK